VPFAAAVKQRVLSAICGACWKEWEGVEVKVINEYRLNFMDPQHREMLQQACLEFLKLAEPAPEQR
jgi:Fe-S cluster biosynthesis and repair protein YggX